MQTEHDLKMLLLESLAQKLKGNLCQAVWNAKLQQKLINLTSILVCRIITLITDCQI